MTPVEDWVFAKYLVEDAEERLPARAKGIAEGLTVGSWTDLPALQQEQLKPYCGTVEDIQVVDRVGEGRVRATLTIGYPTRNLTASIPALLTTVFGKLSMDGRIKLVGLTLPSAFIRQFPGPKFGITGLRELCSVQDRPLLMSIFKSCIGLSENELTSQFIEQAEGGADLIKDDEIFFSEERVTPERRAALFADASRMVAERSGHCARYAVNLTGPTSQLRERAKRLADQGANALLFNAFAYGLDVLQELAADTDVHVPILAHPAVSGALYASPEYGISAHILLGQLLRLAGADVVIYPSPYGSVTLEAEEGRALVQALYVANGLKSSVPAPSAGIHPGLVPILVRDFGKNLIVNAGGGIHGHPDGARAGGQAFRAAIEAVVRGVPLSTAAADSPELLSALQKWGVRES